MPNSAPPSFVPVEKVDIAAYLIMKGARQLELGNVSSAQFLAFAVSALTEAGAVTRRKKIDVPPEVPSVLPTIAATSKDEQTNMHHDE